MIRFHINGAEQVSAFFNDLEKNIKAAANEALREVSEHGKTVAKKHIESQDLNWTPLSKRYIKFKQQRGRSTKILIATGSYLNAITAYVKPMRAGIGVLRGERNEDGQDLTLIAKVLEYGSKARNIPARPLWREVREELKEYIATRRPFLRAARIYIKR